VRQIEPNSFICANSEDVLRDLSTGFCDMILTDPPYGVGWDKRAAWGSDNCAPVGQYGRQLWDSTPPDTKTMDEIRRVSKNQIVWGGNHFAAALGNSSCWLVWNKDNTGGYADCELAYTNFPSAVRMFTWRWNGMLQQEMGSRKETRYHPTQKPVPLFVWCLLNYSKPGDLIIDPYSGSGTTALACHKTGRRFICIEREREYHEIAQQRYADLVAQQELFGAQNTMEAGETAYNSRSTQPEQLSLDGVL